MGKTGGTPVPIAVNKKHYSKEQIKNREQSEAEVKSTREQLSTVPAWIEDNLIARNEFIRIVEETEKIGLLDNLDLSVLAVYCNAYAGYIFTTEMLKKEGIVVESGSYGDGKMSPYLTAQSKYVDQIFKCSAKLGLATTDRLKIAVAKAEGKSKNKFSKYIGEISG